MNTTSNIQCLFPHNANFEAIASMRATLPFADDVIDALGALSSAILKDRRSRQYPDVVTFAFFIRKSNLVVLKNNSQLSTLNSQLRLGRGLIFHIAPSNVPINFGYSMVAGLLAGNNNVVRVSQKEFPQVNLIAELMNSVYEKGDAKALDRVALVKYDRSDKEATDYFSSICNTRVIWGGDATISKIRESEIPARSFDVCFADRYSMAAINADELVSEQNIGRLAEGFYNDTYLFDQNACSAPHLVVWTGREENICKAKELFWNAVHDVVSKKYQFQSVMAVDKQTALFRQAVAMNITQEGFKDNLLRRVALKEIDSRIDDYRCTCGYFTEYTAASLDELDKIIKNKYQTLVYYGFEHSELEQFVLKNRLIGIDRIVPIGHTTDFDLVWDGYDLIKTLSRVVSVK